MRYQRKTKKNRKNYGVCFHAQKMGCAQQRCAWTGFRTFWIRTPAASSRIRSEVFFQEPDLDWIWVMCLLRNRYWLFA